MLQRRNISFIVLGAVVSFTFVAAPYRLVFNGSLPKLQFQTAAAKDKDKDKDKDKEKGKGKDNNGGKGQGNNSGGQGQGNSTISNGQGGAIGAESADQGGGNLDQADAFGADFGRRPNEHNNPVSGTKIKIDGSDMRVLHPDGMMEEIRSGNYEMKDAMGRTIIRRRAKESDRARLRGMN